jgi:hypothetical protein
MDLFKNSHEANLKKAQPLAARMRPRSLDEFLCGGAFSPQLKELFLKNRHHLQPVDYHPKSQEKLPPEERDEYRAFELTDCLAGKVDGRKVRLNY